MDSFQEKYNALVIKYDALLAENEELKSNWLKNIPMGRMGFPEEIANAALFLASPLSSYITAQVLSVDGGITY